MIPALDIFKVYPSGEARWLEPVQDMEAAKARLKVLGKTMPGKYFVFSHQTGQKFFFNVDQNGELSDAKGA